ncbi:MAG: hypothetical protein ACRD0K_01910 [Egibacteraceae bacterium]
MLLEDPPRLPPRFDGDELEQPRTEVRLFWFCAEAVKLLEGCIDADLFAPLQQTVTASQRLHFQFDTPAIREGRHLFDDPANARDRLLEERVHGVAQQLGMRFDQAPRLIPGWSGDELDQHQLEPDLVGRASFFLILRDARAGSDFLERCCNPDLAAPAEHSLMLFESGSDARVAARDCGDRKIQGCIDCLGEQFRMVLDHRPGLTPSFR